MPSRSEIVTSLLESIRAGSEQAVVELWEVVYDELHDLARSKMRVEAGATLQPTMLVNEAYMRLVRTDPEQWESRAHFFGAAAEAMRRVLVDRARSRLAAKRNDIGIRVEIDDLEFDSTSEARELLELEAALERLSSHNERHARIVKLRFFAGLTNEETAAALGLSRATIVNEWRFARAWLQREMQARRSSE